MDATQLGLSLRTSQDSCQPTEVMRWGASSMSWPTFGAVGIEWGTLDAQHFGVPQRRRRVFIVAWFDPRIGSRDPLLPVAARCQRHPQPSGAERPRVAASLTAGVSSPGVSAPGRRAEDDVNLVVPERERERETVNALRASPGGPDDNWAQAGHLIVQHQSSPVMDADTATTLTERRG